MSSIRSLKPLILLALGGFSTLGQEVDSDDYEQNADNSSNHDSGDGAARQAVRQHAPLPERRV